METIINALKPGQSVELSRCGNIYVTAERTGDGKLLRFVRHSQDGFEVFHTVAF
jgi:uncharacterized membrane protein